MPLAAGDTFAGFSILRQLGSGGMGEVYLVNHPRLPRREALKILPAAVTADAEFRQRFNREAEIAATLWHPHIVAVHDRGEFDGQLWITMDFVEGTDAAALIQDHYPSGLTAPFAAQIVTAVADALDYAHERGLLHRDVKPANIMVSDTDPTARARRILLTDFGIARRVDDTSGLTATNTTVGSIAYAAPEQLMGSPLDGRADQYALAATAFHLLTGKPPFDNSNAAVVISSHLSSAPPRIADRRPDLGHLDPVISRAMAKDPAARYPSSRDFAEALGELAKSRPPVDHATMVAPSSAASFADQPTQYAAAAPKPLASDMAATPATATPPRRRRIWPIAAGLVAAAVLVAGGVFLVPRITGSSDDDLPAPVGTSPGTSPGTAAALPLVAPTAVGGLLLSPGQVSDVVGQPVASDYTANSTTDSAGDFNRPECAGATWPLESQVYDRTGATAMRQVSLQSPEGSANYHLITQSVALMPSAERAQRLHADSEQQWRACAGAPLTVSNPNGTWHPTLADVHYSGDVIVQDRTVAGDVGPGYNCQHSLGVWSNVVAEALVCSEPADAGDQALTIVKQILANAQR